MTGVLELGAVSCLSLTASSTLGAASFSNFKRCYEGLFKKKPRHHQNRHHLEPPHHPELLQGPLRQDGVKVKVGSQSLGKQGVEFNGEILSVSSASASATLAPVMALGDCEVSVNRDRVVISPPSIPTAELTFGSPEEAKMWADQFKEAVLVGPPQDRIQELIAHSMRVEKHVNDLRARSEKVSQLEEQSKKLKKHLALERAGMGGGEPPARSSSTATVLAGWLTRANTADLSDDERQKLENELQQRQEELVKTKSFNEKLTSKIVEHARTDHSVALK